MRISELSARSRVPVTSIKYYLREGLLLPGAAAGATQASYSDEHVRRLRLIKALSDVAGLPIQKVKVILGLIDEPDASLFDTLGRAIAALPPYLAEDTDADGATRDYPLAREALAKIGQLYDPRFVAVAQFDHALQAAADVGLAMSDERLATYAEHLQAIARLDLERLPQTDAAASVEYAVLGTALYEQVMLAMRRLAHQDLAAKLLAASAAKTG